MNNISGKNKGEISETYAILNTILNTEKDGTVISFGNGIKVIKRDGNWLYKGKLIDLEEISVLYNQLENDLLTKKTVDGIVNSDAMKKLYSIFNKNVNAANNYPDLVENGQEVSIKSLIGKDPCHICYTKNGYVKYKLTNFTKENYEKYINDSLSSDKKKARKTHNALKYVNELGVNVEFVCMENDEIQEKLSSINSKLPEIIGKLILVQRTSKLKMISEILDDEEQKIFKELDECITNGYSLSKNANTENNKECIPMCIVYKIPNKHKVEITRCKKLNNLTNICDIIRVERPAYTKQPCEIWEENGEYFIHDTLYTRYRKKNLIQILMENNHN